MTLPRPADKRLMAFWETRWKQHRNRSFLRQTQKQTPEQWQAFYDRVAGIWSDMAGLTADAATAVADLLVRENLIRKGGAVLEIGCGPGTLALALADHQIPVTALDQSSGMIRVAQQKLADRRDLTVRTLTGDWRTLSDSLSHETAIAAFFPEACSSDGIHHIETLATDTCILILGDGRETFSLRHRIWDRVMPSPCPDSGFHCVCAEGYLSAAGRAPRIFRLSIPVTLTVDEDAARTFFTAYFSMFGIPARNLAPAIHEALLPCRKQDLVCVRGTCHLVILGWHPRSCPVPETRA
jgi:SAM-dependent methyltransferase